MNALEWVDGQVWLITPSGLNTVRAVAGRDADALAAIVAREGGPELVAAKIGKRSGDSKRMTVRDGVATIPVHGTISRYSSIMQDYCGGVSTEAVARDVQAALDDPSVRAVLYDFDTPGGDARGVLELAGMIRAASEVKPSASTVTGQCCSAGLWLASATGEVNVSPTSVLGSVGAVYQVDTTEDKNVETFVSEQSPHKRAPVKSEAFRESMQARCDGMAAEFIAGLAANRGTTPAKVQATYGRGGTMLGREAVKVGMADRIGTHESTHARLVAGKVKRRTPASAKPANPKGTASMNVREFFASLIASNPAALESALSDEELGIESPPKYTLRSVPVPPAFDADAERAKLRAEVEAAVKLEAADSARADLSEVFTSAALAFVASVADRTAPAEADRLAALYVDAAMADKENPLSVRIGDADHAVSRLDALKASVEARPRHGRGESVVPADATVAAAKLAGFAVLPAAGSDASAAAARLASDRRMVEMARQDAHGRAWLKTPEGLAALANVDTAKAE